MQSRRQHLQASHMNAVERTHAHHGRKTCTSTASFLTLFKDDMCYLHTSLWSPFPPQTTSSYYLVLSTQTPLFTFQATTSQTLTRHVDFPTSSQPSDIRSCYPATSRRYCFCRVNPPAASPGCSARDGKESARQLWWFTACGHGDQIVSYKMPDEMEQLQPDELQRLL